MESATPLPGHGHDPAFARRAEDALGATESAHDAIVTIDGDGLVTAWNAGAERLFRFDRAEAVGRSITMIVPERLRDAHRQGLARVVRTGTSQLAGQTIELVALRADGSEFAVEMVITRWRRGDAVAFTSILRDVSERVTLYAETLSGPAPTHSPERATAAG